MKLGKPLSILSAALLGLSAAAALPLNDYPYDEVFFAQAADGDTFYYGNYEFTHGPGSGGATLTGYVGSSQTANIPSHIYDWNGNRLAVKRIDDYAFVTVVPSMVPNAGAGFIPKNITSVTIPPTVTEIGSGAFRQCSTLQTVSFSSNLQQIGDDAFRGCDQLTQISLPASLQTIGSEAFYQCDNLYSVSLTGATSIGSLAFSDCPSLYRVSLTNNCHADADAFENCPNLLLINNSSLWQGSPGGPVINPGMETILKNCFLAADNVGFITNYCAVLKQYVVATETRSWMSEAVKARQLHDWLIRHCDYEDENDGETLNDRENHTAEGLFLSFGLNVRGNGIGETVCEGFSKAYTALLAQAGIEAYTLDAGLTPFGRTIYNNGHAWNLVKVDGAYYQVDVTWDDGDSTDTAISYQHFLKSNDTMTGLHSRNGQALFNTPHINGLFTAQSLPLLNSCTADFADANQDGLLDSDWNFSGTANWDDYLIYSKICAACNVPYISIDNQRDFLGNLLIWGMSPEQWAQTV